MRYVGSCGGNRCSGGHRAKHMGAKNNCGIMPQLLFERLWPAMLSVQANCIHSVADRGACGAEDIACRRDDQMMMYSLYDYFSIDWWRGQEGFFGRLAG